jgi:hypothetical protein
VLAALKMIPLNIAKMKKMGVLSEISVHLAKTLRTILGGLHTAQPQRAKVHAVQNN